MKQQPCIKQYAPFFIRNDYVYLKCSCMLEMKVYFVTQVLKQGININHELCPKYLNLETHTHMHCKSILDHKYRYKLSSKIMSVKLLVIVILDFKCCPSTYCLLQGTCLRLKHTHCSLGQDLSVSYDALADL